MPKKDEVKKMTGKEKKTSRPAKPVKTKPVEAKAPAKTQKKPALPGKKTERTLKLKAPRAGQVSIVGSFNEWDPIANVLNPEGDDMWSCTLAIEPGEYEYRFVVDGAWCDDPANMLRRPNEFGTENCVLIIEN